MKEINFYEYLPKRYAETSELVKQVRDLIYNFKDGDKNTSVFVAKLVSRLLWKWYGSKCSNYTVVCVPSSNNGQYRHRFCYFSAIIANRCNEDNPMKHVIIYGKRNALHRTANHIVSESAGYRVQLDKSFFAGRKVIVFDDLITTGKTAEHFAEQLTAAGAEVLGGMFLARTIKGILKKSYWGQFAEHDTKIIRQYNKEVAHE